MVTQVQQVADIPVSLDMGQANSNAMPLLNTMNQTSCKGKICYILSDIGPNTKSNAREDSKLFDYQNNVPQNMHQGFDLQNMSFLNQDYQNKIRAFQHHMMQMSSLHVSI